MRKERNARCKKWLEKILKDNEGMLCEEVRNLRVKKRFTRGELKRARVELGVKTYHQFDEYGATDNYFWYLED